MQGYRVWLILLCERSAKVGLDYLQYAEVAILVNVLRRMQVALVLPSSNITTVGDYRYQHVYLCSQDSTVLNIPVPIHQSSCSVHEYVLQESFCTAVASSQPGILGDYSGIEDFEDI
jgi:hypothetical protein